MAFPFFAIPALIQGIGAVSKMVQARRQEKMARDLESRYPRPVYRRPEEIDRALGVNQMAYRSPTSSPAFRQAQDNLLANQAAMARSMRESGISGPGLIALMAGAQGNTNRASNNLYARMAQDEMMRRSDYTRSLGDVARAKDAEFEYNEAQPHAQAMESAAMLHGAGMQNQAGGWRDLATVGGGIAANMQNPNWTTKSGRSKSIYSARPGYQGLTLADYARMRQTAQNQIGNG